MIGTYDWKENVATVGLLAVSRVPLRHKDQARNDRSGYANEFSSSDSLFLRHREMGISVDHSLGATPLGLKHQDEAMPSLV